MKNLLTKFILSTLFVVSCQTKATNIEIKSDKINVESSKVQIETSPTPKSNNQDINSKIGIVDVSENEIVCLRTKNADLIEDTPITIVGSVFEFPQKIILATVEKKLRLSCAFRSSEAGEDFEKNSYYSLKLPREKFEGISLGFAIINPSKPAKVQNGLVSIDINEDGKAEYFRHCASYEGIHLTIWTGKPLKGKRIWHSYYYLVSDIQADCTAKETKEIQNSIKIR